jgi:hypothetical protein
MPLGSRVKDPQGGDLLFDVTSPCVSGVGEHYTATRSGTSPDINDVPLYYIVGSGEVAPGTEWKLYCWKFCPFSLEWQTHYGTDGFYTYTTMSGERVQYSVASIIQRTHAGTKGRMAYHQRGRIVGFICVDPKCYYYTTTSGYFFQV